MQEPTADQSRIPVPPPVLTRAVETSAELPGAPLMPPFVPGSAPARVQHAERAAEALAAAPDHPEWATAPAPGTAVAAGADAAESLPWEDPAPPARSEPAEDDAWPLLMEEGSAEPAWDNGEEVSGGPAEFPLDAFIIPEDTQRLPTGYEEEYNAIAERVASRLDDLARQVRSRGLGQLGAAPSPDELTRLIAAVVAGYMGRGGDA